jgi:hypothetical protein
MLAVLPPDQLTDFPWGLMAINHVPMWYQLPTAIRSEAWRGGQAKGKQRPSAVWERRLTS